MSFALKSKKMCIIIGVLLSGLLFSIVIFWSVLGTVWTRTDFQALDFFYRYAAKSGKIAPASARIVYLSVTNDTYRYFGKNTLDRKDLAKVNTTLEKFHPEAVAYDIIFARPSTPVADQLFAESLKNLGNVYLPLVFKLSEQERAFMWEAGTAYTRLQQEYLTTPLETGRAEPFYALRALMPLDEFAGAAKNSGHVNAASDTDGIYRHHALLIKVDDRYMPTLSLSMFLDHAGVSFQEVLVDWGREIRIPATRESRLEEDIRIPIDARGRVFIPFPQVWQQDFALMAVHDLLEYAKDVNLQGNLLEFFENKFVFIGDVSHGLSDTGQTPLEDNVPLIVIHTALLNGLFSNRFYRQWSAGQVMIALGIIAVTLGLSALPKSSWWLYLTGSVIFAGIAGFTCWQFLHLTLFPLVMVGSSVVVIFGGLVIGLEIAISWQQAYIRQAFAKYVPETVVAELIAHPEKLELGGEKREISVLFSDLHDFTTISEKLPPEILVQLLNEYFSEMTEIILAEGGTIDKYVGDAIMAEFGSPLSFPDHADRAVCAALKMQRRLRELRPIWAAKGLPELVCRIGINTGSVIIGNMGSNRVFDYTVIGKAVNLAARLESANKQYNTSLMISEHTCNKLTPHRFLARVLDLIQVKGKSEAVKVFEIYAEQSDALDPGDLAYYQTYQTAFEAYLSRDFATARGQFMAALRLRPDDPAAAWLLSRMKSLNPAELPKDWEGSVKLTTK